MRVAICNICAMTDSWLCNSAAAVLRLPIDAVKQMRRDEIVKFDTFVLVFEGFEFCGLFKGMK